MDRRSFCLMTLASASASHLRFHSREDEFALGQALLKRPKDAQAKLVAELRHQVATIDSPWLRRVQGFAEAAAKLQSVKVQGMVRQTPQREEASPLAQLPFAIRHEYVWGHRAVLPIEKRQPLVARSGKDSLPLPLGSPVEDWLAMFRGLPPDLDLAIAGAQAELDQASSADKFALFLESWRNGQESFYRALDRAAGTKEAVFFFDAMLGEFQARFAPKGASELKSLQQLHDALHDSFLAYRQYRAMREAAACAAVLPGSVRLPKCLERYDSQKTGYGLRDDLWILACIDGHDPRPGLQMILAATPALPSPLWSTQGKYDALPPFQKAFEARLNAAIAATNDGNAVSSDGLRDAGIEERKRICTKIAELAHAIAAGS